MNIRLSNLFWGILLMLSGGIFLAQNLGYLEQWSPQSWMWILAGLSLAFFVMYVVNGFQKWGWLFPASIFGGAAITLALAEARLNSALVAVPVLASVAVPFLVAFALAPRQRWWALIPIWVIGVVITIMLVAERVQGEWIAALVMYAIGLPFLAVYLFDQTRRWALLPAFVLCAVGIIPLLATRVNSELIGAAVLFMIALPFFFVYIVWSRNWWALIPAGILASIGLQVFLTGTERYELNRLAIPTGVMFVGWAVTFGILWLQRAKQPTDWTKYPALVFAIIAAIVFLANTSLEKWWPILLISAGVLFLLLSLRPRANTAH